MKARFKRDYIFGVLFFSGLWGASEAILGDLLYRTDFPFASVPLTIIAFIVLTIAKGYLPQTGSAIFIGSVAMLYKFLNAPFFSCHLAAIFLLGLAYDLVFSFSRIKSKMLLGLLTTYLGYIFFAFAAGFIFRFNYWLDETLSKIISYIGVSGTLAALINSIAVPIAFRFSQYLKTKSLTPFKFKSKIIAGSLSLITFALWFIGIARWF
jgi:hypothetical protein